MQTLSLEMIRSGTVPLTSGLEIGFADHVLAITLNRESKKNAITYDMYLAIVELLNLAKNAQDVRCVLFNATGSIFTAGHDVSGFTQGLKLAYDEKPSYLFMQCLANFPKPVVAALNGNAIGIGATMLFHCDLVYAVPDCLLVFPFTGMGLIPEFASTTYLPLLLGHRKAMALLLHDRKCSAAQAVEWGIVNETIPIDQMSRAISDALADIVALSPDAVEQIAVKSPKPASRASGDQTGSADVSCTTAVAGRAKQAGGDQTENLGPLKPASSQPVEPRMTIS